VIIGGGAAGLTAAIFAARAASEAAASVSVTILERTSEPGKKILMSGGTRANVLPLACTPEADFSTQSRPSALRAALAAWPLDGAKAFLEQEVGLGPLVLEEASAKYFPASDSARDVRDGLVRAALREGATLRCGAGVGRVEAPAPGGGGRWRLWLEPPPAAASAADGPSTQTILEADAVVLACGGSSFPKVGTDGAGYRMLRRLGVAVRAPYPALTPLSGAHPGGEQLAGVTLPAARLSAYIADAGPAEGERGAAPAAEGGAAAATATKRKKKKATGAAAVSRRGGFLFSHRGFTGPAVLDVSEHWVRAAEASAAAAAAAAAPAVATAPPAAAPAAMMRVAWTGEGEDAWAERLRGWTAAGGPRSAGGTHVATLLQRSGVPARLAAALCAEAGAPASGAAPAAALPKTAARALARLLGAYELPVTGHRGFALAEVTGGGVPLEALDARTMEVVRADGDGRRAAGATGGALAAAAAVSGAGGGGGGDGPSVLASAARSGLHVCGELVDVHGRIGGFNFLWAWASGRSAGLGAIASALRAEAGGDGG